MGGIVLHEGDIAEMKTGEGKTFVAVQALYLNAHHRAVAPTSSRSTTTSPSATASGRCPSTRRSACGRRYIENMMPFEPRREAYQADVTYGTNSEFGFDYLRDNMAVSLDGVVQRGHAYAIVDEVDSILDRRGADAADHLRRAGDGRADLLRLRARRDAARPAPGEAPATRKGTPSRSARTTSSTRSTRPSPSPRRASTKVERALRIENLYAPQNSQLVNHLIQALKAQSLFQRDVDYVIQDGEVKIVDEFTGRIMEGRRWSEGLHQAVEAKEGVRIQEEHQTLATITLQNYFRLYEKLAGMTGTAKTEEKEFVEIYDLSVVEIPTNVAGRARRQARSRLQDEGGQVRRRRRATSRSAREQGPAGPRRHDRGRDLGVPVAAAHAAGRSRTTS